MKNMIDATIVAAMLLVSVPEIAFPEEVPTAVEISCTAEAECDTITL